MGSSLWEELQPAPAQGRLRATTAVGVMITAEGGGQTGATQRRCPCSWDTLEGPELTSSLPPASDLSVTRASLIPSGQKGLTALQSPTPPRLLWNSLSAAPQGLSPLSPFPSSSPEAPLLVVFPLSQSKLSVSNTGSAVLQLAHPGLQAHLHGLNSVPKFLEIFSLKNSPIRRKTRFVQA